MATTLGSYCRISPSFWTDPDVRRPLTLEQKHLLLYYFTSPHTNMIGFYYLPLFLAAHETGIPVEDVRAWTLGVLSKFVSYDEETEEILVHAAAKHQIGTDLKTKDKRVTAVERHLKNGHSQALRAKFLEVYRDGLGWPIWNEAATPSEAPSNAPADASTEIEEAPRKPLGSPLEAPSKPLPREKEAPSKPFLISPNTELSTSTSSSHHQHAEARGLEELKEYLGEHAAAADRFAASASHSGLWPKAIMGLYGPGGTDDRVWGKVAVKERPALLATALDRYAGEACEYNGRYFRRFLEAVVAELHGGGNGTGRGNGGRTKAAGGREAEGAGHFKPGRYDHLVIG